MMLIRLADLTDLDTIMELINACSLQLQRQGILQWDSDYPSTEHMRSAIRNSTVHVGLVDNRIVATLTIGAERNEEHHSHIIWQQPSLPYAFFNRLAVLPEYQGRGFAAELMDYGERYAERVLKARSLRLDARAEDWFPMVRDMYGRRGYRICGSVSYRQGTRTYVAMEKVVPESCIDIISPPFISEEELLLFRAALQIRKEVFIDGQQVPARIERDGLDEHLIHFIVRRGTDPAGCLRFRKKPDYSVKLERIAVLGKYRQYGYGKQLVSAAVEYARQSGFSRVTMHAQYYLLDYYASLGFVPVGSPFSEADIEHIRMERSL